MLNPLFTITALALIIAVVLMEIILADAALSKSSYL